MVWAEVKYVEYLRKERRLFAWVMRRHGGLSPDEAEAAAFEQYPYEPRDAPFRELVFHNEAWHWAMLTIYGTRYGADHPELAQPSADYKALC